MKKTILFFFVSLLSQLNYAQIRGAIGTAAGPDSIKRNLALVVGISSYPHINRLLYADDDAYLFADYLVNEKICDKKDVTILIDSVATKANFFKELRKLLDKSGSNDRVFIYFAGHGDVENDIESGFLLTYNCEPNNYPATDAIDISMLEKFVGAFTKKNTKVVLITDACRSGNLAGGMAGASSTITSLNQGFQNVIKILSCHPNQLSQEKFYPGGGHGVFTYHLIDGLSGLADKDNDQYITLRELDRYLDEVAEETKQEQVPKTDGDPMIRIASFSQELKLALLARKSDKNSIASLTKTRGGTDSSWLGNTYFQAFTEHIRKNRLTGPEKTNALNTLREAKVKKQPAAMVLEMELELAAILEDEAQQFINKYLRGDLPNDQKECLRQLVIAKDYIQSLEAIIGTKDLRYNEIHVKKLFFDAYYIFKKGEKNKYKEAVSYLEQANALSGNQAWILNALGLFYEDLGQFETAEKSFYKASALAPQWSYPWNNLGRFYWQKKQHAKAETAYRKSLELDPSYGFAWNGLGNVLDDLNRNEEAIEAYKKSIEFNPHDDDPWNGLGNVYYELNKMDEAEAAYLKAIGVDSTDAMPWNGIGILYMDHNRYTEAEKAFQNAIRYDSGYVYSWNNFGILRENQHRFTEAEMLYKKASMLDTNYVYAFSNLGSIYLQMNKPADAAIAFQKAINLEPGEADNWNGLGIAYKDQFKYPQAIEAYLAGLSKDSTHFHSWYNLAVIYKNQERYSESADCLKKAVTYSPATRKYWDLLLKMLEKLGNEEELAAWKKNKLAAFPGEN